MAVSIDPAIPVTVHQVGHDPSGRKRQIGIKVFYGFINDDFLGIQFFFPVRGITEPRDLRIHFGYLLSAGTVGIHLPELHGSGFRAHECDFLAIWCPGCRIFAEFRLGDLLHVFPIHTDGV